MSWIDIVAIIVFAATVAVCSERRITGLVVGVGAVILYRPLLMLAGVSGFAALGAALAGGLVLGLLGRRLAPRRRGGVALQRALGGAGGVLLAGVMVLTLGTSLPLGTTAAGTLRYPPEVAQPLTAAVRESRLLETGRDILLYPLLAQQGFFDDRPALQRQTLAGLHRFMIAGRPWDRR